MTAKLRALVKSKPLVLRIRALFYHIRTIAFIHMPLRAHSLPPFSRETHLDSVSFRSFAEFEEWKTSHAELIEKWQLEDEAALPPGGSKAFQISGVCAICNTAVDFLTNNEDDRAKRMGPNWREGLACPLCKMCNRVRASLHLAIQDFGLTPEKQIYTTEQVGLVYRWLRAHFTDVLGSEYLPPGTVQGFRRFGIHHQDVQSLSLATGSVDCIITFDVLEHIPDPPRAFASFARVLRPGGRLVMTAPFTIGKFDTTVRAKMLQDGRIEHLMPIEVHGNPIDPDGSLCFRHFGWDVLEQLMEAGFADARVHVYHNRELGYLGCFQSLISAVR